MSDLFRNLKARWNAPDWAELWAVNLKRKRAVPEPQHLALLKMFVGLPLPQIVQTSGRVTGVQAALAKARLDCRARLLLQRIPAN